jgi:hypothetical protein
VNRFLSALLILSVLPACSLIQPLDAAKPAAAGGSSNGGDGNANGGDGNANGGDGNANGGDGNANGGDGNANGGDGNANGGDEATSGGSHPTVNGGASPSGGAGGKAATGGAGGKAATGGAGGKAATGGGGAGGSATTGGTGGGPPTGPYCSGPVTPCGGSLLGTWELQSSCVILSASDPTVPAACQGAVAFQGYEFTGTVTFTQSSLTFDTNEAVLQTLKYTSACISALHADSVDFPRVPAGPASTDACSTIAGLLAAPMTYATCPYVAASSSCNCSLDFGAPAATGTDAYVLVGAGQEQYVDEVTDPNGDYPVSFCVRGTTLTTSQSSDTGQVIQHVLTLR